MAVDVEIKKARQEAPEVLREGDVWRIGVEAYIVARVYRDNLRLIGTRSLNRYLDTDEVPEDAVFLGVLEKLTLTLR